MVAGGLLGPGGGSRRHCNSTVHPSARAPPLRASRNRRVYHKTPPDRVALFVPCKGADTDTEPNLRAMFEQDHTNYELVFIVENVDDDACQPIRRLIAEYPGRQARLVLAGVATTSGQKVHNLLVATGQLPSDATVLAFADADIRPPSHWLRMLTQRINPFAAASGYRWFVPKRPSLANLLVASIDSAVVPLMFPSTHHKVWGGSWAIRREVFESSGLREAWRGTLSDDLVASNVLRTRNTQSPWNRPASCPRRSTSTSRPCCRGCVGN